MAIVDQHGNPISSASIEEAQTASLAALHQEFATHPVRGLTPGKLARILESAERGDLIDQMNLFEDMEEKDGHILAELSKRKRSVLGLQWTIEPPRNASVQEQKDAEYAKELIGDIPDFEDVLLDALDGIGKGFACLEFAEGWRYENKEWLPGPIVHRPQAWFTVDQATRTELRLRNASGDGEPLQPFGWVTHIHKAKSGYVTRAGLLRCLAWPFLFKNYSVRDLAEFLEIYGLPLRLGTYPRGANDDEKRTLLRAVVNIGHAAAGIVPEGMMIDFKDAAKGTEGPFNSMIDWCERTQSKVIVGQTLSAEASGTGMGSGVADLQGDVRWDITVSDARQLDGTLTRDLVYPILVLNGRKIDNLRRCPRFKFQTELEEDLNTRAERDTKLFNMGFEPTEQYIEENYGEGWVKKASPASPTVPGTGIETLKTQHACRPVALKSGQREPDVVDHYTAQALANADQPLTDMINSVRDLIDELIAEGGTMDDLQARLLDTYQHMPPDDLANVMQLGFAAAELAGRFDVIEGN